MSHAKPQKFGVKANKVRETKDGSKSQSFAVAIVNASDHGGGFDAFRSPRKPQLFPLLMTISLKKIGAMPSLGVLVCSLIALSCSHPSKSVGMESVPMQIEQVKKKVEGWLLSPLPLNEDHHDNGDIALMAATAGESKGKVLELLDLLKKGAIRNQITGLRVFGYFLPDKNNMTALPDAEVEAAVASGLRVGASSGLLPAYVVLGGSEEVGSYGHLVVLALVDDDGSDEPRIVSLFTTPK